MNSVEERKQRLATYMGVSPQNTTEPSEGEQPKQQDKYEALEYTSYKDMLSSKIQAAAAKEQAQKYIETGINASGFAGQGIADSTKLGIQSSYLKAIGQADEAHTANMVDIAKQKADEEELQSSERWQSAMTMLQQARNQADIEYIKENFYESMTDDQKKMFDYYAASYSDSFGSEFKTYEDQANDVFAEAFNVDENGNATSVKNEIAAARYTYNMMQEKGYYVQGLGKGGNNDDIDITVGKSSRDKETEFDLKVGGEVSQAMANNLTQATGGKAPAEGTLVISGGNLYIYTSKGWKTVASDRDNVKDAVQAFKKLGITVL